MGQSTDHLADIRLDLVQQVSICACFLQHPLQLANGVFTFCQGFRAQYGFGRNNDLFHPGCILSKT